MGIRRIIVIRCALIAIIACFGAGVVAVAQQPDGRQLFINHCAACHGRTAEGDGPVASALNGGVPNLRTLAMRNGGEYPADAVAAYIDGRTPRAAHGDRLMPVWGSVFAVTADGNEDAIAARIELLVQLIRELQYR